MEKWSAAIVALVLAIAAFTVILLIGSSYPAFGQNCGSCGWTADAVRDVRARIEEQLSNPVVMSGQTRYGVQATPDTIRHYRKCAQMCREYDRQGIETNLRWIEWAINQLPRQKPIVIVDPRPRH